MRLRTVRRAEVHIRWFHRIVRRHDDPAVKPAAFKRRVGRAGDREMPFKQLVLREHPRTVRPRSHSTGAERTHLERLGSVVQARLAVHLTQLRRQPLDGWRRRPRVAIHQRNCGCQLGSTRRVAPASGGVHQALSLPRPPPDVVCH